VGPNLDASQSAHLEACGSVSVTAANQMAPHEKRTWRKPRQQLLAGNRLVPH